MAVNKKTAVSLVIGVLVVAILLGIFLRPAPEAPPTTEASIEQTAESSGLADQSATPPSGDEDRKPQEETAVTDDAAVSEESDVAGDKQSASEPLPNEDILPVRTLGDPNAPVVIEEFSSLTCGHCGAFHQHTLDDVKAELIDTGKVYWIYHEFPLNRPALDATLLARCMPGDRYWTFTDLLFQSMDKWAYGADYRGNLRQNAKLAGLSDEQINDCLNDEELANAVAARIQHFAQKYKIEATPTFIINGGEARLVGNQPISVFKTAVESAAK